MMIMTTFISENVLSDSYSYSQSGIYKPCLAKAIKKLIKPSTMNIDEEE